MPSTVQLHRDLATKPDKVYRAFVEADAKASGCRPTALPAPCISSTRKVGGTFKMSFRNFTTTASGPVGTPQLN
jgi:hypothetical protein